VGTLIAALVNIGKSFGFVQDGTAPVWSAVLNIVALIALFAAQISGYANLVPVFDAQAGEFSNMLNVVVAFLVQFMASRKSYESALAGLPVIGKSYSLRLAGESIQTVDIE